MEKVTSRAELKIVQLEPWLEPARLGLITSENAFFNGPFYGRIANDNKAKSHQIYSRPQNLEYLTSNYNFLWPQFV